VAVMTVTRAAYVFRWARGRFVAAWLAHRADEHVPDAMISVPESINHSRATVADLERIAADWLAAQLTAADPAEVGIVFTYPADAARPSTPVRDDAGRVRVHEINGNRVGWARLTDIEWTDVLS
jgi:hypothetical protein